MSEETRGEAIRSVDFLPPTAETGPVELSSLARMRRRAGPGGFATPQRLGFDLLVRIEQGHAKHTVDFTEHRLDPGDVLWVRAGQVHRWGDVSAIEGQVVLLAPHVVDARTRELVGHSSGVLANRWSAGSLEGSAVEATWALLQATVEDDDAQDERRAELRAAVVEHAVGALVLQLVLTQQDATPTGPARSQEAYLWFRDEIEQRFSTHHQVSQYAARPGYSARTLTRLARTHTGLSAKELIDERVVLEARRILNHTDLPVAEVAARLGFDDPSNFSSYFLKRTGRTPGTFRQDHR